jgi:uncharacterized LabA/DUF88 family protein
MISRGCLDIASVAYKRQADQIVLVAGDADFVPAAKLARREGIDFILDPCGVQLPMISMNISMVCVQPVLGPNPQRCPRL